MPTSSSPSLPYNQNTTGSTTTLKTRFSYDFPLRLYDMLDDAETKGYSHIVSWCDKGDAFKIHDPSKMIPIMQHYFHQNKYKSFLRQLQAYSFVRVWKTTMPNSRTTMPNISSGEKGKVSHPEFHRGRRSLCVHIKRKRALSKQHYCTADAIHANAVAAACAEAAAAAGIGAELDHEKLRRLPLPASRQGQVVHNNASSQQQQQRPLLTNIPGPMVPYSKFYTYSSSSSSFIGTTINNNNNNSYDNNNKAETEIETETVNMIVGTGGEVEEEVEKKQSSYNMNNNIVQPPSSRLPPPLLKINPIHNNCLRQPQEQEKYQHQHQHVVIPLLSTFSTNLERLHSNYNKASNNNMQDQIIQTQTQTPQVHSLCENQQQQQHQSYNQPQPQPQPQPSSGMNDEQIWIDFFENTSNLDDENDNEGEDEAIIPSSSFMIKTEEITSSSSDNIPADCSSSSSSMVTAGSSTTIMKNNNNILVQQQSDNGTTGGVTHVHQHQHQHQHQLQVKKKKNEEEEAVYEEFKFENHRKKWLNTYQLKVEDNDNNNNNNNKILCSGNNNIKLNNGYQQQIIECPTNSDVLCGRGNTLNHPGNVVLKSIVMSKLDEYISLHGNTGATKLTWDVVHLLKNKYGARFLRWESRWKESTKSEDNDNGNNNNYLTSCWIEVSNEQARLKVRYAFRDRVRKQTKKQQTQQQQQQQKPEQYRFENSWKYKKA